MKQMVGAGLGVGLLAAVGCTNDKEPMPGPGPTAMPRSLDGRPTDVGSGVNTEMRQGGSKTMSDGGK